MKLCRLLFLITAWSPFSFGQSLELIYSQKILGESVEIISKNFGKPIKISESKKLLNIWEKKDWDDCYLYQSKDITLVINIKDNKSTLFAVWKKSPDEHVNDGKPWTEDEVKRIVDLNAPGHIWTKMALEPGGEIYYANETGTMAYQISPDGTQLTMMDSMPQPAGR